MALIKSAWGALPSSVATFSALTMVSRLFGYLRDAVIFIFFGAGGLTDAFLVAFRVPNFLRRLFAEGAFSQAFVPVLSEAFGRGRGEAREVIDRTAGALLPALLLVTAAGVVAAPILIKLFAPGFSADAPRLELAGMMLRITFPYLLFISLTALCAGVLNSVGRFAVPAATPVLLNLSLIAAAIWLAPRMDEPITALATGVLIAGVAQLALQLAAVARLGLLPRPRVDFRHPAVRRILKLMSPAAFASSVVQINLLVDTAIASFLAAGSISWLYLSDRFVELPVGLFGVALATVLLPSLSRQHAAGDRARFCSLLDWGARAATLLALPCVVGLIVLGEAIFLALLQYRAFTPHDARMAAASLAAYALGLPAFMLIKVYSAAFFSRQNTRAPVRFAVWSMLANLALNLLFLLLWTRMGWPAAHAALALATSASAWLNCMLLWRALSREGLRADGRLAPTAARALAAAAAMGLLLWWLGPEAAETAQTGGAARVAALLAAVALGAAAYAAILFALGARLERPPAE